EQNLHMSLFTARDQDEYDVSCPGPCTVLEAIKSTEKYQEELRNKWLDENVVIRLGQGHMEYVVATHFPCTCISDRELVTIFYQPKTAEKIQDQNYTIYPREEYSVFYIDTIGGKNAKSKKKFRNNVFTKFKYLRVYAEKGMTVEQALKRDGRFTDDLGGFSLSDNDHSKIKIERTQPVDNQDDKKLKLCYRHESEEKTLQENPHASIGSQHKSDTVSEAPMESPRASGSSNQTSDTVTVSDVAQQRGISVGTEEIYELPRKQFPDLIKLLESRFPGDSFRKEIDLRKENFGKIQASFSEGVCQGTGFVLFDNFILTNVHLFREFKDCIEGRNLKDGIDVFALFNYDDPEPKTNYYYFRGEKTLIDIDGDLDYAIIELNPEGLLKKFGPMPPNGEACIIGHPAGGVKKMDPTCIIEKEKREQAVDEHLWPYRETVFIIHSIRQLITNQGIEDIMMGGNKAEQVVTYNTFMYHGSSGSPVFDGQCRVFGLHTAGYVYEFRNMEEHVIECAHPLLTIFESFVSKMKEERSEELLKRVQEEAKGNPYLEKIVKGDESMDVDEE
uniref:Serine protease n=1 Tax=Monopterus albus TaxID=43700 RepID=A0A3Q3IGW0_MONAL